MHFLKLQPEGPECALKWVSIATTLRQRIGGVLLAGKSFETADVVSSAEVICSPSDRQSSPDESLGSSKKRGFGRRLRSPSAF
jgi:hypothetical protein